jgi:hypothetical protein
MNPMTDRHLLQSSKCSPKNNIQFDLSLVCECCLLILIRLIIRNKTPTKF